MIRILYFFIVVIFWIHLPLPIILTLFIIGGLMFPWYVEGVISAFFIDFYLATPLSDAWWPPYFLFTVVILLVILGRKYFAKHFLMYN